MRRFRALPQSAGLSQLPASSAPKTSTRALRQWMFKLPKPNRLDLGYARAKGTATQANSNPRTLRRGEGEMAPVFGSTAQEDIGDPRHSYSLSRRASRFGMPARWPHIGHEGRWASYPDSPATRSPAIGVDSATGERLWTNRVILTSSAPGRLNGPRFFSGRSRPRSAPNSSKTSSGPETRLPGRRDRSPRATATNGREE